MRLSDGLKAKRGDLLDAMEKLARLGETEQRLFSAAEQAEWERLQRELAEVDAKLAAQLAAEDLLRGTSRSASTVIAGNGPRLIADDGTVIRALTRADRLSDTLPPGLRTLQAGEPPPSIARALRGVVLGDWSRATRIERAMGEGVLAQGGFAVPSELSALWLDNARSASVCMQAGAITIPMSTSTLRIVRIDGDPTVYFRQEHQPITESDLVFAGVDLKARTAGILCRVSVELLEDSPIANAAIETAMSGAMGLAFDRAMLAGDGNVVAPADNPTGLLYAANVNEIAAVGMPVDYDPFIDAYVTVLNNNGLPNAWVLSPTTAGVLWKTATGITDDATQLKVPVPLDTLPRFMTTSLNDQKVAAEQASIVGDFSMLGLALRTGLTLEASRTAADVMSKVEVLIRLYARIDVAILRPKFFTRLLGLTATAGP